MKKKGGTVSRRVGCDSCDLAGDLNCLCRTGDVSYCTVLGSCHNDGNQFACIFCRSSLSPSPTILLSSQSLTSLLMSHTHSPSTSSNFQLIFDNALKTYKKCTKMDLFKHPLADQLQACNSPSSILAVLQKQVQELNGSQRSNTKWLDPTVNVLHTFSETLGEGVGSVCFMI